MSENLSDLIDAATNEFKENYVAKPVTDIKTDERVNMIKNKRSQGVGSISNVIAFKDTITGSTFTITVGATHLPDPATITGKNKGVPSSSPETDAKLLAIQQAVIEFLDGMHNFI